jgi:hypothetical protein
MDYGFFYVCALLDKEAYQITLDQMAEIGNTLYLNSKNCAFSSRNTFYGKRNTPCTAYIRNGLKGGVELRPKGRPQVDNFETD